MDELERVLADGEANDKLDALFRGFNICDPARQARGEWVDESTYRVFVNVNWNVVGDLIELTEDLCTCLAMEARRILSDVYALRWYEAKFEWIDSDGFSTSNRNDIRSVMWENRMEVKK